MTFFPHLNRLFPLLFLLSVYNAQSQQIASGNIICNNCSLDSVLNITFKHTGLVFNSPLSVSQKSLRVTINMKSFPIDELLKSIFKDQPFYYKLQGKSVSIIEKKTLLKEKDKIDVAGIVTDKKNNSLSNVSISCANHYLGKTAENGRFSIRLPNRNYMLEFTCVGYKEKRVIANTNNMYIVMDEEATEIDSIVNYGSTTRQKNTGSIYRIVAADLGVQPGKEAFNMISGIVPGVWVTPSNGSYGAISEIKIRGKQWIGLRNNIQEMSGSSPLLIVDGVQLPADSYCNTKLPSLSGNPNNSQGSAGCSIFRIINQDDIEYIDILKDADATAIYGSRGANGVIIIHTKMNRTKQPRLSVNLYQGIARAPVFNRYLNTNQYLELRKEALLNDKTIINSSTAPDLVNFGAGENKDFPAYFAGGIASITDLHIRIAGGSDKTAYQLKLGYYRQGTILPDQLVGKHFFDRDISVHGRIQQQSKNGILTSALSAIYTRRESVNIASEDILRAQMFLPNVPELQDKSGQLNWYQGIQNPIAFLHYGYEGNSESGLGNLKIQLNPITQLKFTANLGLHMMTVTEHSSFPIAALKPVVPPSGTAEFATNFVKNFIAELMGEYTIKRKLLTTNILLGGTFLRQSSLSNIITGTGYTSDQVLFSQAAAGNLTSTDDHKEYKHAGMFVITTMEYLDRLILKLSGMRDGSSRYGPKNRFGNFAAIGFAWLIGRASPFRTIRTMKPLKIRISYGITGNDQIGDFMYNDVWGPVATQRSYGGGIGFMPQNHYNDNYSWELSKKFEMAMEWKLFQAWMFSIGYYHNISTNQLITESTTSQTGFGVIRARNFDAKVLNNGVEFSLEKKSDTSKLFAWSFGLSGTIPNNRLLTFPGLKNSIYDNTLTEGKSLSTQKGYRFLGIDPQTGYTQVAGRDTSNQYNQADFVNIGNFDQRFYGGIRGCFLFKSITLNFGLLYAFQSGKNQILNFKPGQLNEGYSNVPQVFENRWQKPGDVARFPRLSASSSSAASNSWDLYRNSDQQIANASFLRLTNVYLGYTIPLKKRYSKTGLRATIYLLGENIYTNSRYIYADPITQSITGIPTLKRYAAGIKIEL